MFSGWRSDPAWNTDVVRNEAIANIGTSRDTSESACDSIGHWWTDQGQLAYPNATSLLMLVDSGGSNSSRHTLFKQDLQTLADMLGIPIRVAHYPPYTSCGIPLSIACSLTPRVLYKV